MKVTPWYVKFSLVAISIGLIIFGMRAGAVVLIPLCWSLLFALLLLPLTARLEGLIKNQSISIILSITVFVVIIFGVFYFLSAQVVELTREIPQLTRKFNDYFDEVRQFASTQLGFDIETSTQELTQPLTSMLQQGLSTLQNTLGDTVRTLTMILIMPVFIFFILYNRERFNQFIYRLFEGTERETMLSSVQQASGVVQKYIRGIIISTTIVGILSGIVFVSIGLKHFLFFAAFVAIFNLIPYVGVFIASTVCILYTLISTDSLLYPVLVMLLLWGIQLLEGNLIRPLVVGREIKLNPFAIILIVFFGALIWGVSGMILFIPILGVMKVFFDNIEPLKPYGYLLGDEK